MSPPNASVLSGAVSLAGNGGNPNSNSLSQIDIASVKYLEMALKKNRNVKSVEKLVEGMS